MPLSKRNSLGHKFAYIIGRLLHWWVAFSFAARRKEVSQFVHSSLLYTFVFVWSPNIKTFTGTGREF